jgi:hypothetical protein
MRELIDYGVKNGRHNELLFIRIKNSSIKALVRSKLTNVILKL